MGNALCRQTLELKSLARSADIGSGASVIAGPVLPKGKMFILFKLIIVCLSSVYGKFIFLIPGIRGEKRVKEGTTYFVAKLSSKKSVWSTTYRFPFKSQTVFKLSEEKKIDRFFKMLGLSKEFQTRDSNFDSSIYIACDSSSFNKSLAENNEIKEFILSLFRLKVMHITCDGQWLTIKMSGDKGDDFFADQCFEFVQKLDAAKQTWALQNRDRFFTKMILIEAFLWAIGTYAVMGFYEFMTVDQDVYIAPRSMISQGLIWGSTGGILFTLLVFHLMSGSSRSHRIIIESLVVIVCSFPVGGIAILSDLNIHFDRSPPQILETQVMQKSVRRHVSGSGGRRGGRRRTTYTYYLSIMPKPVLGGVHLPSSIQVDSNLYSRVIVNQNIVIEVGQGRFHYPWYRSIRPKYASR